MATKKTTKGTSAGRPKKTISADKVTAGRKVSPSKPTPTEEEIRKKAEEIYHERIARGEYGTAADDWHKAEALLKGLKTK
jgi:hypothetical protein